MFFCRELFRALQTDNVTDKARDKEVVRYTRTVLSVASFVGSFQAARVCLRSRLVTPVATIAARSRMRCGTGVPPVNHGRDGRATIWLRPSGSLKIWPGQNPQEELHSEEDSPYATWLLAHPCLPSLDSMSGGLDRLQTVKMAILHAKESAASL